MPFNKKKLDRLIDRLIDRYACNSSPKTDLKGAIHTEYIITIYAKREFNVWLLIYKSIYKTRILSKLYHVYQYLMIFFILIIDLYFLKCLTQDTIYSPV